MSYYSVTAALIHKRGESCVLKSIGDPGLQILPRQDRAEFRRRHNGDSRAKREREVQHFRRDSVGHAGTFLWGTQIRD